MTFSIIREQLENIVPNAVRLINFAEEVKKQSAITATHRTYVMFNHVRIIKQLFVTSDDNRRNLITHEQQRLIYRACSCYTRSCHANVRFNREEIITKLPFAMNLRPVFNTI